MSDLTEAEQNRLILDHMDLPVSIAATYRGTEDIPFEDLKAEGMLGLVQAARNFDPSRGASFKTWAMKCVNGKILDFIKEWDQFISRWDDEDEDRVYWWDIWADIPTEGWAKLETTPEELRIAFEDISDKSEAVNAALLSLSKRERRIIKAAFLRNPQRGFDQIARDEKLSYKRVTNIVYGAISKMRRAAQGYTRNRDAA